MDNMVAMSTAKLVMFKFSRASPRTCSLSFASPRRVSRVCFSSSASRNSAEGQNSVDPPRDSRADMAHQSNESMNEIDEWPDMKDETKGTAPEAIEWAEEKAGEMKEREKGTTQDMNKKAKEAASSSMADSTIDTDEKAKEYAHDTKEKTKGMAESVAEEKSKEGKDSAKETAHGMKEPAEDMIDAETEKAEGTRFAKEKEAADSLGEKAKQKVAGAWEAAKATTQKIKDTVIGTILGIRRRCSWTWIS
ncbi:hypothetical protein SAY86_025835 [Trapa natans]|uniref:Uncharacterized protein n=1 Tax=Trapa natans TaxID=22666 RepID=A0AAN7KCL8_TRANT|nr:hypothetical protein SAY86_025835 [Trapa natans]